MIFILQRVSIIIDAQKAIEIAEKFLEKYHDTISLKSSELNDSVEEKVWELIFDVGFLSENIKKVKVDANNGKILSYK